jgi:hypothetical protein
VEEFNEFELWRIRGADSLAHGQVKVLKLIKVIKVMNISGVGWGIIFTG